MRINLVNYEAGLGVDGILTKYAREMHREITKLGVDCTVSVAPDPTATINHHINYLAYKHVPTINTLMITHFTQGTTEKLDFIKASMRSADVGICFSPSMMRYLRSHDVPKLDYVLPAHDNFPRRRKRVAILTKTYPDGRKREWMLGDLCKVIDKDAFTFLVMGDGWQPVLQPLAAQGFDVKFSKDFDANLYRSILEAADYVLYTGDEDCMPQSILDATQAGVRTIAPVHDWQEDLKVSHAFTSQEELNAIFLEISRNPVADWTWETYSRRHIDIWKRVLSAV